MSGHRGVHGRKIEAALANNRLAETDRPRLKEALHKYDQWVSSLDAANGETTERLIENMVALLNSYKQYVDFNLIFESTDDFLYRQKGQLKIDNTVVEEFLPIFVRKCITKNFGSCNLDIGSQVNTFSSANFASSIFDPGVGGNLNIRTKDQDFSISRTVYVKTSYSPDFREGETREFSLHLGYIAAEIKTNLDKTMYQESCATARDIKLAVTGAKYFLLCDFLDMPPISTITTDIDEILILRKAKRISSNIRESFRSYEGRQAYKVKYYNYLHQHPYSADVFKRFVSHIFSCMRNETLIEEDILNRGFF